MYFSAASRRSWDCFSAIEARCMNAGWDGVNGGGGNKGLRCERYVGGSAVGDSSSEVPLAFSGRVASCGAAGGTTTDNNDE